MNKLEQAKTSLLMKRPFYGSLALQLLKWEYSKEVPTAATDGKKVMVNADFYDELSMSDRTFICAHEIMHVIYEHLHGLHHYTRTGLGPDGKEFSRQKWAKAIDYVVNGHLIEDGFTPPKSALIAPNNIPITSESTAVDVYCKISDQQMEQQQQAGKGSGEGGDGEGFDKHEEADGAPTEADRNKILRAVAQAAEQAQRAGNCPAHAQRLIDQLAEPRFNLKDVLMHHLEAFGKGSDWTWRRPNKRRLCMPPNLFMPTQSRQSAGNVVVGMDVSGSISPHTLNYFAAVLTSSLQELSFDELWVTTIETDVNQVEQIQSQGELEQFLKTVKGGGGTYMPSLFKWIQDQGVQPTQVVFLTDGYTDFGHQPGFPVIWCITSDAKAPYGVTVKVEVPEQ